MVEYPMVKITWVDAVSADDWEDTAHIAKSCPEITTLGYLIFENDEVLSVAMQLDPTNEKHSMSMTIPNFWIKNLEYLEIT